MIMIIIEGSDNSEAVNRFRNISEAWQVLSKAEVFLLLQLLMLLSLISNIIVKKKI